MYKLAFQINPKSEMAALRLGWTYVRLDRAKDGIKILKKGLKVHPDSFELKLFLAQAMLLEDGGDIEFADQVSQELLQVKPNSPDAFILRARILERKGDFKEAETWFERAVKSEDGKVEAFFHLSQMFK